ncbi:MAG: CTP-dependent riboflavin kinase [Candidatus Thorarchaeota archaeon]|nr:CTP-dependent riboflavin kinase [Candidatus Thorarchaeota archaeon]
MMIIPDIWFTLYSLARKGALHRKMTITTRELGEILDVSQQTASRRITQCVEQGYLDRIHTVEGMSLQVTNRGREELMHVFSNLEIAFTPPEDDIVIKGVVVTGLGEGAYYVDVYSSKLQEALGFRPHLGTLNVKITDDESRKAVARMKNTPPLVLRGFTYEGRTFGDVICYRVKVNERIESAIVIAQRTHHSEGILEVVAPVNIRRALDLDDEDEVTLKVIPLHQAT